MAAWTDRDVQNANELMRAAANADTSRAYAVYKQEILDTAKAIFTADPASRRTAIEKTALTLLVPTLMQGAMGGLAPMVQALVFIFGDSIIHTLSDAIDSLGQALGFSSDSFCNHPELWTKHMDDNHWIRYPGADGRSAVDHGAYVTPDLASPDVSWIRALPSDIGPNLPAAIVPKLPPPPRPGSFESYWRPIYMRLKEVNTLQDCVRLAPEAALAQDEAVLVAMVLAWNATHHGPTTTHPPTTHPGDGLITPHRTTIRINRGPLRKPRYIGPLHRAFEAGEPTYLFVQWFDGRGWIDLGGIWYATPLDVHAGVAHYAPYPGPLTFWTKTASGPWTKTTRAPAARGAFAFSAT